MGIISVAFAIFLGLASGGVHANSKEAPLYSEKQILRSISDFESKIPKMYEFRNDAIDLYVDLNETLKKQKYLTREDSKKLYLLSIRRIAHRNFLTKIIEKYENALKLSVKSYQKRPKQNAYEALHLVTAAYFWLDDNFMSESIFFQMKGRLRRFINEQNMAYSINYKQGLKKSAKLYYSFKTMYRKSKALKRIKKAKKWFKGKRTKSNSLLKIEAILNSSYSYKYRITRSYFQRFVSNIKLTFQKFFTRKFGILDFAVKLKDNLVFGVSYGLGRSILQIQWKKGKLYRNKEAHSYFRRNLVPGDVLWDKTRHKLTGKIISLTGFWGHNAIYIGNRTQLEKLGIWNHHLVKKYHRKILRGKTIIEALRKGVELNNLHHFMNADDMALARIKMTKSERARVVLKALAQMGKKYDYGFNIESAEKIICSELIYVAYETVNFDTGNMIGKMTIDPNLIGKLTINDGPFKLLGLYYNGRRIHDNLEWHMKNLLNIKKTNVKGPSKKELEAKLDIAL